MVRQNVTSDKHGMRSHLVSRFPDTCAVRLRGAAVSSGPAIRIGRQWHPLFRAVTVVGRRSQDGSGVPDIDLADTDQRRSTSRRHAELRSRAGIVQVRDLRSANGTRVNGEDVGPDLPVRLRDGDRLSFGGVEASFAQQAPWPDGLVPEAGAALDADAQLLADQPTMLGPRPLPQPSARRPLWRRLLRRG